MSSPFKFWLPTGASHSPIGKTTEPVKGANSSNHPSLGSFSHDRVYRVLPAIRCSREVPWFAHYRRSTHRQLVTGSRLYVNRSRNSSITGYTKSLFLVIRTRVFLSDVLLPHCSGE